MKIKLLSMMLTVYPVVQEASWPTNNIFDGGAWSISPPPSGDSWNPVNIQYASSLALTNGANVTVSGDLTVDGLVYITKGCQLNVAGRILFDGTNVTSKQQIAFRALYPDVNACVHNTGKMSSGTSITIQNYQPLSRDIAAPSAWYAVYNNGAIRCLKGTITISGNKGQAFGSLISSIPGTNGTDCVWLDEDSALYCNTALISSNIGGIGQNGAVETGRHFQDSVISGNAGHAGGNGANGVKVQGAISAFTSVTFSSNTGGAGGNGSAGVNGPNLIRGVGNGGNGGNGVVLEVTALQGLITSNNTGGTGGSGKGTAARSGTNGAAGNSGKDGQGIVNGF